MNGEAAAVPAGVLRQAYDACTRLARTHYENFPVASVLLPRRMRPAIAAVYAFARRADDFADEPGYAPDQRIRLLDDWQRRLDGAAAGAAAARGGTPAPRRDERGAPLASRDDREYREYSSVEQRSQPGRTAHRMQRGLHHGPLASASADDLIFVALADAIREHDLPVSLFSDLLSAFRQDVTTTRYERWEQVLDYCSRSANPVGRLVLRIAGYRDAALDRSSDALCTALQLTNFWQDFAGDWQNGRLYVPRQDYCRHGAHERELEAVLGDRGAPGHGPLPAGWRSALREMALRTRELFAEGRPVCERVRGRLKYELRLTWHGGWRILERLERSGFDVAHRPALRARDAASIAWRAALWNRSL